MNDLLKVLVMGGKTEGFHEFKVMEPIYRKFLGEAGFDVTLSEDRDFFTPEKIKPFHVILDYTTGDSLTEPQQQGLLGGICGGKGFIGVHSAADSYHNCRRYERMVGGVFLTHPAIQNFTFKVRNYTHPIMQGVTDFVASEELYLMDLIGRFEVLLTTYYNGFERECAWVKPYGQGRVFFCALGHGPEQHEGAMFQKMIVNAVHWTAASKP